jgi:hypothetical protein
MKNQPKAVMAKALSLTRVSLKLALGLSEKAASDRIKKALCIESWMLLKMNRRIQWGVPNDVICCAVAEVYRRPLLSEPEKEAIIAAEEHAKRTLLGGQVGEEHLAEVFEWASKALRKAGIRRKKDVAE